MRLLKHWVIILNKLGKALGKLFKRLTRHSVLLQEFVMGLNDSSGKKTKRNAVLPGIDTTLFLAVECADDFPGTEVIIK